ncbi:hypothetical protein HY440_02265 [Candidatus Microgenomates bacterium]|nr:hypothetical protein [Candidatus Microgenomates bacterium]
MAQEAVGSHWEQHKRAERQRKQVFVGFLILVTTLVGLKYLIDQQQTIPPVVTASFPPVKSDTKTDFGNLLANFSSQLAPPTPDVAATDVIPTDKLFELETKEHAKMNPGQIQKFLEASNKVFPGPKISPLTALTIIYTEAGFGSLQANWAMARGSIQLTPIAQYETTSKLRALMKDPATRPQTADFFAALGLPNRPESIAVLDKDYQTNIDTNNALGILHLQQSVNFLNSEITKDHLENLPEETLTLLQASSNYSPLAPAFILSDLKGVNSKDISPVDVDHVLTDWLATNGRTFRILDHYEKDKPIYKDIFFDSQTIKELRSYLHRLQYFQSFLLEAARQASEGNIKEYPNNFTSQISKRVNSWLAEDLKKGQLLKTPSAERLKEIKAVVTPTP